MGCARSQKCRRYWLGRENPDGQDSARQQLREEDEKNKLDDAARSAEIDQTITQTEDIRKTRKLRQEYSRRVYLFLRNRILFVGILAVLDSVSGPPICEMPVSTLDTFELIISYLCRVLPKVDVEQPVMLAIVGATTVAVIGLVLAAVKGLFPRAYSPTSTDWARR